VKEPARALVSRATRTRIQLAFDRSPPPFIHEGLLRLDVVPNDVTYERIRAGMRRTYQSSLLFRDLTVLDNLFLAVRGVSRGRFNFLRPGRSSTTRAAALDLLERVRLTRVGNETVASLSHGQQRQLEVGMALAGAPRLILFDEPAAGLSPAERRELVALLAALPPHMSFILIEHDLEIALRVVDRVTVMHNGRMLKEGTPADIENDPEVQEIYMGRAGHA
jgi:branched-chain amino acid transport system ATP-binding protein